VKIIELLLALGLVTGAWAQELPNKVDVMITPTCSFSATTGLFHYEYQIQSKPTSLQAVWDFTVEVPEEPDDGHSPTGWSEFYSRTSAAPSPPRCNRARSVERFPGEETSQRRKLKEWS